MLMTRLVDAESQPEVEESKTRRGDGGRVDAREDTMRSETTGTISVLFRAEENEKVRDFDRALRCERERLAAGVVALHIRPGFWGRKGRAA